MDDAYRTLVRKSNITGCTSSNPNEIAYHFNDLINSLPQWAKKILMMFLPLKKNAEDYDLCLENYNACFHRFEISVKL
jgi:hypothetical protein